MKMKSFTDICSLSLKSKKHLKELQAKKENTSEKEANSIDLKIEEMGKIVMDFQTNFTTDNPNILFSKILNASKDIEMPKFPLLADGNSEIKIYSLNIINLTFLTPLIFPMIDY